MMTKEKRAAIYVRSLSYEIPPSEHRLESPLEQCRQYCIEHGYRLAEQHIYQGDKELFWSDAPHLVQLRTAALQSQFDVLVVPEPETLGISWPVPWLSLSATLVIRGF